MTLRLLCRRVHVHRSRPIRWLLHTRSLRIRVFAIVGFPLHLDCRIHVSLVPVSILALNCETHSIIFCELRGFSSVIVLTVETFGLGATGIAFAPVAGLIVVLPRNAFMPPRR